MPPEQEELAKAMYGCRKLIKAYGFRTVINALSELCGDQAENYGVEEVHKFTKWRQRAKDLREIL